MNYKKYSISQIKEFIKKIEIDEEEISKLRNDPRKSVQILAKKYANLKEHQRIMHERWSRMNKRQILLKKAGYSFPAGIDEAGRGPLAGPVVAASVILNPVHKIIGLNDSKKLSSDEREKLYIDIYDKAISIGVGIVDNNIIDRINILQASFVAMRDAINNMDKKADFLLVDGNREIPDLNYYMRQEAIINGDCKVNAIAAASIIAKVTRDRIMDDFHKIYPEYGFIRNKGYGTKEHIMALKRFGPTPIHRNTFSIVEEQLFFSLKRRILESNNEEALYQIGKEISLNDTISEANLLVLRDIYRKRYLKFVD
jgi:ribonuclease HII